MRILKLFSSYAILALIETDGLHCLLILTSLIFKSAEPNMIHGCTLTPTGALDGGALLTLTRPVVLHSSRMENHTKVFSNISWVFFKCYEIYGDSKKEKATLQTISVNTKLANSTGVQKQI